ncbi:unnamed protein product, partial [marine sediment metagenome]
FFMEVLAITTNPAYWYPGSLWLVNSLIDSILFHILFAVRAPIYSRLLGI